MICSSGIYTPAEEAAYERFCRIQGYPGPMDPLPDIKNAKGKKITDWCRIADECVYAPTSKVHVFKTKGHVNTKNMKLGDIIYITAEGSYRNEGTYVFDGAGLCPLDGYPDDYGTIPSWASRLPITYFSIPSKYYTRSYGVIDHNEYAPIPDPKEWVGQIKAMIDTGDKYCVVKDHYVVINDFEVKDIKKNDDFDSLYLTHNGHLFSFINRENIPTHGIVHKSLLNMTEQEAKIWKKTGIPPHHMYYTTDMYSY